MVSVHHSRQTAEWAIARQRELKQKLRTALANHDESQCWARVETVESDDLMKLLAVRGSFYAFLSCDRNYETLKADSWLVHEDEFLVHWVGGGPNMVGSVITGRELEESFFMYA